MTKRAVHTMRTLHSEHSEHSEHSGHSGHSDYAPRPVRSVPGQGAWRRALAVAALAATVPYLTLKTAWLAGSRIGIPDGSVLLDPEPFLIAANAVTVVMDACVILLVLVLTRPWGLRVPAWLLTVPVFVATGLLAPIVTGFPGQLLVRLLGFGEDPAAKALREPFLDPWVFNVVYTGFGIQGLALAGLFVPYARERWGRRWQGVLGPRLPSSTGVVAAAAAAAGLAVAAVYVYWALGGTAGLGAERAAAHSADTAMVSGIHAMCALAAGAGALILARGGALRARWPLGLAWIGAGAALSWGTWMLAVSGGPQLDGGEGPPAAALLTYAGQMITGSLAVAVLTRFLISRREG
ncbi:hypothetical protein [Streptomyces sp. NBC_01408]|uniref:hypothetical protein n=1 Tax=Streptomyces sp. NBC_01408 TaxID=2903855 RepID=UPI0022549AA7|nr:hypothetical protein [Streptomyces sp. NBC_01408]MCX4694032.1 hypothetical protein [Streptomyces sp. NBC_01408]